NVAEVADCVTQCPRRVGTIDLQRVPLGGQVSQEIAEALGAWMPTDDEPQAQGIAVDLPLHPEFDPLPFGQLGVDRLEPLVAQRLQTLAVFTKRLHDLRSHPCFGPDEKAPVFGLYTT